MRKRLFFGVAALGYGRVIGIVTQLALVPILATHWGLVTYGQWIMLSAVPTFIAAGDFGFASAAGVQLAGQVARGELDKAVTTFQSGRIIVTLAAGTVALLVAAVCWALPAAVLEVPGGVPAGEARMVVSLLCLYAFLILQTIMFTATSRAMGRFPTMAMIEATIQLAEAMAVMAVAVAGHGLMEAAAALVVIRAISHVLQRGLAKRAAPWLVVGASQARRAVIRELLRPSMAAMAIPLAQAAYLHGTSIAVGAAAGPAAVPVYASLRTLSRVGLQLINMFVLPLMPEYTAAYARGDRQRETAIAGGVTTLSLGFGAAFGIGLGLLGETFVTVWTHGAIHPPQAMITLTAIGIAAAIVSGPLSNLLLASNRHETYSYTFVACAVLAVGLTYLWVGRWGVTGVAAATLILEAVVLWVAWRSIKLPVRDVFQPGAWRKLVRRSGPIS